MKSPLTPFLILHIWRQSYWLYLQTISRIWPLLTTSSAPKDLSPYHQCYKTCLNNASSRSSPCPNPLSLQAVSATRGIILKYKSDHLSPLLRILNGFLFSLSIKAKVLMTANMIWPPNVHYLSTLFPYCSAWFSLPQPLKGTLPPESLYNGSTHCKELSSFSQMPTIRILLPYHLQAFAYLCLTL